MMMMIMRTWHHPTRTFLPSQVRGLLRGQIKRCVACGLEGVLGPQETLAGLCRHIVSFMCAQLVPGTTMVGVAMPLPCP